MDGVGGGETIIRIYVIKLFLVLKNKKTLLCPIAC